MTLRALNSRQRQAVEASEGYAIIAAGPGTGKTLTFAHRVAYLLEEKQVPGEKILAVTFTRSAAKEMQERLNGLLSNAAAHKELADIWMNTFHSVALRVLREQGVPFGSGVDWSVADDADKRAALRGIVPPKEMAEFLQELGKQKQKLLIPESSEAQAYQKRLLAAKRLDFDDLFIYACQLFERQPEILERYRRQFHYLLVDEFQDTSFAQYQFMARLASENLCVLGDPDQAIYGFVSDSFLPFEQFKKDYPEHRVLPLSDNYRSQSAILQAAKQVIEKNPAQLPRELSARLEQGFPIEISSHQSEAQEAEMIVRKIEGLLGGASYFTIDSGWADKEQESYSYGLNDIAVLYRFHVQARKIEQALDRAGLPYRKFAKDPKKNGKEAISLVENLADFQNNEAGLEGEGIRLMTLHRSKGVEFPVVFILGCEDGVIPYYETAKEIRREKRLEEERRLFYVGMTRAKNRLFLSYVKKRFLFGKTLASGPSPFLQDIEAELRILQKSQLAKKKSSKKEQLTLFE